MNNGGADPYESLSSSQSSLDFESVSRFLDRSVAASREVSLAELSDCPAEEKGTGYHPDQQVDVHTNGAMVNQIRNASQSVNNVNSIEDAPVDGTNLDSQSAVPDQQERNDLLLRDDSNDGGGAPPNIGDRGGDNERNGHQPDAEVLAAALATPDIGDRGGDNERNGHQPDAEVLAAALKAQWSILWILVSASFVCFCQQQKDQTKRALTDFVNWIEKHAVLLLLGSLVLITVLIWWIADLTRRHNQLATELEFLTKARGSEIAPPSSLGALMDFLEYVSRT